MAPDEIPIRVLVVKQLANCFAHCGSRIIIPNNFDFNQQSIACGLMGFKIKRVRA
jgi:hypothetical protein